MPVWLEDLLPRSATAAEATAVLVAIGVLLLLVAALRRRSRGRRTTRISDRGDNRLAVVEWSIVDERRRLLLVRRDEVEHLVMIGGPTDIVVESNIGLVQATPAYERQAAPRAAPPAQQRPAAAVQNAAAVATLEQAALAYAPTAGEARRAHAEAPAGHAPEQRPDAAAKSPAAKPRPPLTAVPAAANAQPGRAAPDPMRRPGPGEAARGAPLAADADRNAAARRQAPPARKEPSVAGATNRWAGNGQAAAASIGDVANMPDRIGNGRAGAANDQGSWNEPDDIENEIVRALNIDPFPPLAFPAANDGRAAVAESGLRTSASATMASGATLGDLADKLEEALAREVRPANQGRQRLDLDLDAFTNTERVQPAAAAPVRQPEPEARRESPAPVNDDPPVISLSSRRREMNDPIEDEMARLLGELTDGARR